MNDRGHLSSLDLDRLRLSSLPAELASSARAHLESCLSCRASFEELQADSERFQSSVLPRTLPALARRVARPPLFDRLFAGWRMAVPVAATAMALCVVVVAVRTRPASDGQELGIKGGPTLQLFASRGAQVFPVREGSHLKPGDRIRFVVDRGGADSWLFIASIDGAKNVSVYFPTQSEKSAPVAAGRVELPGSIELDGVAGKEQLFAFFSKEPLDAAAVREALSRWPEPPRLGARLVTLAWEKDAP